VSVSVPSTLSVVAGAPLVIAATVTTVPGGAAIVPEQVISFTYGDVIPSQALTTVGGVATANVVFANAGTYTAVVSFSSADNDYFTNADGSIPSAIETHTITITVGYASTSLAALTVDATALVGGQLNAATTLTRTAAPTGSVAGVQVLFTLSGPSPATMFATTNAAGAASVKFDLTTSVRGNYQVSASYGGSSALAPTSAPAVSTVVYQRVKLVLEPVSTLTCATTRTYRATLTAQPSCAPLAGQTIKFTFPSPLGVFTPKTNSQGVATVDLAFPVPGTFPVSALFDGTSDFFTDLSGTTVPGPATQSSAVSASITTASSALSA